MPIALIFSPIGRAVMAALVIGLLVFGLYKQIQATARARAEAAHIAQVNKDNIAVMGAKDAQVARANVIAAQAQADAEAWRKRFNAKRKDIANAPQSDDGLLAPVLARVLDGLPRPDGDQAGPVTGIAAAGKPHELSGRPQ